MITTEHSIVYQLLNIIRGAELNNDETVDERRIRSFVRSERAEIINMYSKQGVLIQDICFQRLPVTNITVVNSREFKTKLPGIIYLQNNFGVRITTNEYENIPLLNNESYHLSKKNPINKFMPKATVQNQELKIWINGVNPNSMDLGISANTVNQSIKNTKTVLVSAVLENPSDGLGYDWLKSEFPLPAEAIGELKKNILRRDFNLILSTKSDQVPNAKNDTLRYHDQDDVQR